MKSPRETYLDMAEKAQAKADKCLARGQWKAAAKHQARVAWCLAQYDKVA